MNPWFSASYKIVNANGKRYVRKERTKYKLCQDRKGQKNNIEKTNTYVDEKEGHARLVIMQGQDTRIAYQDRSVTTF